MADVKNSPAGAAAPPSNPAAASGGITRRQALRSSMFATIGLFFGASLGGAGGMFWPIKLTGFGAPIPVPKKLSEIKDGEVVTVREGKFYLTKSDEGLIALFWRCVHLGCTVPYLPAQGKFVCPCHGSVYDIHGQNIAGPAPRPLDIMQIDIKGDEIIVNTGKITQRPAHEPKHSTQV